MEDGCSCGRDTHMRLKLLAGAALIVVTGLSLNAVYLRRGEAVPDVVTDTVSRGTIVSVINASGTLEAVKTVQVGSQISGSVQALYADFNSLVKKGQVLARLDPSLVQAEIDQARAGLVRSEAEVERLEIALADARLKEQRARDLAERQLIPTSELEAAEVTRRSMEAQVRSAQAQVTQSRATLSQHQVNLQKTVIAAPMDGIVIARNVDVGQTVAASLQAPTIFEIAAGLSRMQVRTSIDESDLGQVADGQPVTFTVDAYPSDVFRGVVRQVRLNPVVEQNVVTYAAIIDAPNPEMKLRPGMTANVTVETARREDVLRVPSAALRFRPSNEVLAALGSLKPAATTNHAAASNVNTVWLYDGGLHAVRVEAGVSDGTFTEVTEIVAGDSESEDGMLQDGTPVVVRVATPSRESTPSPSSSGNPLMGSTPQRRF
jgi:HlyD family secretion protein